MNQFEVYVTYLALKRHFESSFDFFKYNGKVNATVKSYEKRTDKIYFEKLSKRQDPKNYILSNLIINPKIYIKDLAYSKESEDIYLDWQKRNESLQYLFSEELNQIDIDFNSNFMVFNGQHPKIIRIYLQKQISLETLCILVSLVGCRTHWKKNLTDPLFNDIILLIDKYTPFIQFNREKFKSIVIDKFWESE